MGKAVNADTEIQEADRLISPKRAAALLDVSRSQIDRIAQKRNWSRVCLSDEKRGSVRYRLTDVLAYVQSRTVGGGN